MNPTLRCLLIDDDEDDQELFCLALKSVNTSIQCVCTDSGGSAMDLLATNQAFSPDFIFIDMHMPSSDGIQCLSDLRDIQRLASTPVYIYSTSAPPASVAQSIQNGATDFIVKPSSIDQLTSILTELICTPHNLTL